MKKKIGYSIASISLVLIFIGVTRKSSDPVDAIKPKPARVNPQIKPQRISHAEIDQVRRLRKIGEAQPVLKNLRMGKVKRMPAQTPNPVDVLSESYRGMSGLAVAPKVRAVKSSDFSPDMGDVQLDLRGMTYFQPAPGRNDESFANVVYDKKNNRYFPLSAVLRVQGVGSESRDQLGQAGYQEFYYSSPTRVLFVSSSHERLFQDYRALEAQGFKVSVEVLRGEHRSR